jgi:protoheme IX farnesyltransferase
MVPTYEAAAQPPDRRNLSSLPTARQTRFPLRRQARFSLRWAEAYAELSKARLSALVIATTAVGFVLGRPASWSWSALLATLIGSGLAALGVNALNQCIEAERDARMLRTRRRPLPAGTIAARHAWLFGCLASLAGPLVLLAWVNALSAFLTVICQAVYLFPYTPLKTRSALNTLVGAVCGALPPVIGWAAAAGTLAPAAYVLGALLFIWQIPHFLALAWMYREDYRRGGFRMLPDADPSGRRTSHVALLYAVALLPVSLLMYLTGAVGAVYAVGALLLGGVLVWLCIRFCRQRSEEHARHVFLGSIAYLPLLLLLMVLDQRPVPPSAYVESYGFDLSDCRVSRDTLVPAGLPTEGVRAHRPHAHHAGGHGLHPGKNSPSTMTSHTASTKCQYSPQCPSSATMLGVSGARSIRRVSMASGTSPPSTCARCMPVKV